MGDRRPLSFAAPSKVASVEMLRRLGAAVPQTPDILDGCLAEVRPNPAFDPRDRADLEARGVRRFIATIETEESIYNFDVETSEQWFLDLMPLRILANIPDDASALEPNPNDIKWNPEVARGFATALRRNWADGRSPRKRTAAFLTAMDVVHQSLLPVLGPVITLLSSPDKRRLRKDERRLVVEALDSVITLTQRRSSDGEK